MKLWNLRNIYPWKFSAIRYHPIILYYGAPTTYHRLWQMVIRMWTVTTTPHNTCWYYRTIVIQLIVLPTIVIHNKFVDLSIISQTPSFYLTLLHEVNKTTYPTRRCLHQLVKLWGNYPCACTRDDFVQIFTMTFNHIRNLANSHTSAYVYMILS